MSGLPHACQYNKLGPKTAPVGMFKRCLKAYLSPWLRLSECNFLLWPPGIQWRPLQQSRWTPQQLWCQSAWGGHCLREKDTIYNKHTTQHSLYFTVPVVVSTILRVYSHSYSPFSLRHSCGLNVSMLSSPQLKRLTCRNLVHHLSFAWMLTFHAN